MTQRNCKHVPANPQAFYTPCELCGNWVAADEATGLYGTLDELTAGVDLSEQMRVREDAISALLVVLMGQIHTLMSKALPGEDDRRIALLYLAARCNDSAAMSLRTDIARNILGRQRARILESRPFQRWVLANAEHPELAWSGSRWVPHTNGMPSGAVQVCNFDSQDDARKYARQHGLEVTND